ncbi:hypothetical protein ECC02_004308 [Trypanosoma cruzi]|uniref:Mucin TcMUCII n=1 Tax=Trypanosoma cruzi TaxID=5693 RepID=A0A7J6Y7H8_TRYCR|nr:hypothetical protein ECC02_004308 [Trypanosoma cruzi]
MKVLLAAKRKYNPQLLTTNRLEQHQLATATAVPWLPTPSPLFCSCIFLLRVRLLLRWWLCLHEVVCAEYELRPNATELFCDEYWLHFPWTNNSRGVRGYLSLYCYFGLLGCCVRCIYSCVCAYSPWIGVCVVRGVRRTVHAWLLPSFLMWFALCVCLPHLSSPLLLSMSLTVQISSTPLNDHTHDDDVLSAVRPAVARPVLLPVRVRDSKWSEEGKYDYDYNNKATNYDDHYNNKATNYDDHDHDDHCARGTKYYDYRGAKYDDHPCTVTCSQN